MTQRICESSLCLLLCAISSAQNKVEPIVTAELRPTVSASPDSPTTFHWYDRDGHYSLATMRVILANGNFATISQRFERIDNSGDIDSLDEYSLERRGEFKIGKQYMPFGTGTLIHESAIGLSLDTHIIFGAWPARIAYGDDGAGRTRCFSARVGRNLGFSLAFGDHVGTQATSLDALRPPEDATGRDRGYQTAYGMDSLWQLGDITASGELVVLRNGETNLDLDTEITDLKFSWRGPRGTTLSEPRLLLGWCRDWESGKESYRLVGEVGVEKHVVLAPFIRTDGLKVREVGITTRIRF